MAMSVVTLSGTFRSSSRRGTTHPFCGVELVQSLMLSPDSREPCLIPQHVWAGWGKAWKMFSLAEHNHHHKPPHELCFWIGALIGSHREVCGLQSKSLLKSLQICSCNSRLSSEILRGLNWFLRWKILPSYSSTKTCSCNHKASSRLFWMMTVSCIPSLKNTFL